MKLQWMTRARHERAAAIDYIAAESPAAALEQLDQIERQTDMLSQFPEMGRPGRKQGTRELVISRTPFVVVYRVNKDRIEVMRVLHGSQQWP